MEALLAEHADYLSVLPSGRVKCLLSNHEMPAQLAALQAYIRWVLTLRSASTLRPTLMARCEAVQRPYEKIRRQKMRVRCSCMLHVAVSCMFVRALLRRALPHSEKHQQV